MKAANLIIALALTLTSCATMQDKYCNPRSAFNVGKLDAKRGSGPTPGQFSHYCAEAENYSIDSYKKDYLNGYHGHLKERCTTLVAKNKALQSAKNNDTSHNTLKELRLCKHINVSFKKLKKVYSRTFTQTFCAEENIQRMATRKAKNFQDQDFSFAAHCPKRKRANLKRSYKTTYKRELKKSCGPVGVSLFAVKQAKNKKSYEEGLSAIRKCPKREQVSALLAFQMSYNQEVARMERRAFEKKMEENLKRQRINRSRVNFKVGKQVLYSKCAIEKDMAKASIHLINGEVSSFSGYFKYDFYDEYENILQSTSKIYGSVSLYNKGSKDELNSIEAPEGAVVCRVQYLGSKY